MEDWDCEHKNPALFDELMAEFAECWKASDANADGLLNSEEFKVFMTKTNANQMKRYGEAKMPDAADVGKWYNAYNTLTSGCDGISMADMKTADGILKRIATV